MVQLPHGRKIFRSTCVKACIPSFLISERSDDPEMIDANRHPVPSATAALDKELQEMVSRGTYRPKTLKTLPHEILESFKSSRKPEIKGFINNGTFTVLKMTDVPSGTRLLGACFIDELEKSNHGVFFKSRLVAQVYSDSGVAHISIKAPTVQLYSQRILCALGASFPGMKAFLRDITHAYVQSESCLELEFDLKPPAEMNFRKWFSLEN